ncbi:hypothetical protein V5F77_13550 [Xanthobacter sp. DSM 24535]|uniref:hypothetical protein n=1 Tax=Roseixanthobacter psychrophilus TaxID=3119917 RepID=UPI003726E91D
MFRFLFRFFGFWVLAGGFVALVVDGTRSIASSRLILTSTQDAWTALSPTTFAAAQAKIAALSPLAWSDAAVPVLGLPLFLLLAIVGFALLALGRVRQRSRFLAN